MTITDQAWRERDAALLRDQMSQTQMNSMREKLELVENAVKSVSKNTSNEYWLFALKFEAKVDLVSWSSRQICITIQILYN